MSEGSWASSAADSRTKFFSLALGWKCLKSLCRQAVVPAESKFPAHLVPVCCLCMPSHTSLWPALGWSQFWAWPRLAVGEGLHYNRQQLLNSSFPKCTHDPLGPVLLWCLFASFRSPILFLKIFLAKGSEHQWAMSSCCLVTCVARSNPNGVVKLATAPRFLVWDLFTSMPTAAPASFSESYVLNTRSRGPQ